MGFNYAYNFAIARQHGCRTFESVGGFYQDRKSGLRLIDSTTSNLARFDSSTDVVLRLGEMPNDQFQSLFQQNEPSFRRWWEESDPDALRRGFDPFLCAIYEAKPSKRLAETFTAALLEIAGLGVSGPLTASIKVVCQFYVIDQIREKILPGKKHIANRIIHYAISREDMVPCDTLEKDSVSIEIEGKEENKNMLQNHHKKIEKIDEFLAYSDPENHWIRIYFDKVRFPDGRVGRYNRIIENDGVPGVAILPIYNDMVCLVKQYRYPIKKDSWEIPRGFSDSRDALYEAMRELYEETGISTSLDLDDDFCVYDLGTIHPNSGLLTSEVKLFAVVCFKSQETSSKDDEVNEKFWYPMKDILLMIRLSKITDSFTIAALLKANLAGLVSW